MLYLVVQLLQTATVTLRKSILFYLKTKQNYSVDDIYTSRERGETEESNRSKAGRTSTTTGQYLPHGTFICLLYERSDYKELKKNKQQQRESKNCSIES